MALQAFSASCTQGRSLTVYDAVATGQALHILTYIGPFSGLAFSPDGNCLLTSSFDGIVRLWEVSREKEVRRFAGHPGGAFGANFSPDGNTVLTTGVDVTARLWDVQSGQEVCRFTGHTNWVRHVDFLPDGKYILTASEDNTARLWFTDLHDTIRAVCALLTRDLTPEERLQFGISDQGPTCPAQ